MRHQQRGQTATARRRLSVAEKLRRAFLHELWNIGVVDQTAADIVANGIVGTVRWMNRHEPGTLLADPSCFTHPDGQRTLFAEVMPAGAGRGAIWTAQLEVGHDPLSVDFMPMFERPYHLSYPFPFSGKAGQEMLTMESWEAGHVVLMQREDGRWREVGRVLEHRAPLDPTFWWDGDRWWLFCTFRDDGPDNRLHLFHANSLDGEWTPHAMNPIQDDFASARPAGPLFMADGLLIRPAQDSRSTYGGAVSLHVVERLDPHDYRERLVRRLPPVPGPFGQGLHTFCPVGDITLIDGKTRRFDALEFGGRLGRRIRRWGIGVRMANPACNVSSISEKGDLNGGNVLRQLSRSIQLRSRVLSRDPPRAAVLIIAGKWLGSRPVL